MQNLKSWLLKLWRNPVVNKAGHTFWQTSAAVFLVGIPVIATSFHKSGVDAAQAALWSLATGAAGAGLSAVKTMLVQWLGRAE